ncbi:uncharacterized protein TNCV_3664911 [Trichonephila clavipes]|nr:uncharacterized protein TNCV_3664911 [Trichonephila clavipes]
MYFQGEVHNTVVVTFSEKYSHNRILTLEVILFELSSDVKYCHDFIFPRVSELKKERFVLVHLCDVLVSFEVDRWRHDCGARWVLFISRPGSPIKEGRFVLGAFRSGRMRVFYRSRQDDRLRVMLVLVHIDITPPHTPLPVFRRIGDRTIPYSWRACKQLRHLCETA